MSENLPAVLVRSVGWEEPAMAGGGFVLPSGTVTLVLGDVEGSTRAWEADPTTTEGAVGELNELIDELVGRFDGVRPVEQGEGDSFVAAFARARDGVAAAVAIQQALAGGVLRLRLGVHSGDVVRRDEGNYVGPAIIRTARLRNLAHGGQTVVSEATRELVSDNLPDRVSLRDLGVHRLKDLSRPERVFQLCHPDLQDQFPALRSLDLHAHNLPIQRTTFIGRVAETAELAGLIGRERLVTVTGSGGCGKTRLALQVAAETADRFPDGVWFVELAAVTDSDGVAAKAAQVLAVLQGPGMAPLDSVVAHLASQQALLVLDNCEHVLDAAGALVDAVLSGCPGARVLATSRQPLAVDGEISWRVPPLSLPPDDAGPAGIEGLSTSEAAQLFIERAGRARAGFGPDERHRGPIADICRRLDGIPLAIELAAARVRVLSPAQIADGLNQRFALLTGAARTALPRQQTLEASLDWSHALLTEPEQIVFRRLAVFPASFDLDGATAVCAAGAIEPWQVLDLLTLLVDKNLVGVDDSGPIARYRLLETMRLYAHQRRDVAGEQAGTSTRHRDHYLTLAETAAPFLETANGGGWYTRLAIEYPNLRAALASSRDDGDHTELCRLAAALASVWALGGGGVQVPPSESIVWVDAALADSEGVPLRLRAILLWARGFLAYVTWDFPTVKAAGEEGLRIARQLGDDHLAGRCLHVLGCAAGFSNETGRLWEEAVTEFRRANDAWWLAFVLSGLGGFDRLRDPRAARADLDEALNILGSSSSHYASGLAGYVLGTIVIQEGRPSDALGILDQACRDAVQDGFALALAGSETSSAVALALAGSFEDALAAAGRHADVARRTGVRLDAVELQARALVAAATGDPQAATHARNALSCATTAVYRADMYVTCAQVSLADGDIAAARGFVDELLVLAAAEGFVVSTTEAHLLDARIKRHDGDPAAADAAHRALSAATELPAFLTAVDALETLAGLAVEGQSYEEAGRLLGAAATVRDSTGYRLCLSERDVDTALARSALGDERFEAVFAEGRVLSVEDAVAYARRGRGERKRPSIGWGSLTPTEIQIVDLVGGGLTNADIGERLFVSPRTVQSHLTRIYTKLGVTSRTELAARAATERP